jgi:hypothetical protein
MDPEPGESRLADLGLAATDHPFETVSRHDLDAPRALALYVALTTQNRQSRYEVPLAKRPFLHHERASHDGPGAEVVSLGLRVLDGCFGSARI